MGKTVVFLGAGASRALGLPLTRDIFPMLLDRLAARGPDALFGGDPEDQACLRGCLNAMLPGLSGLAAPGPRSDDWCEALPPITDVLSAVDYHLLAASAPGPAYTLAELARARLLLERAVFEILVRNESPDELSMAEVPEAVRAEWQKSAALEFLPRRSTDFEPELRETVDWLMNLAAGPADRVTIISTNYDIEVEQELFTRLGYHVFDRIDFGMRVRDPDTGNVNRRPENARIGVYKLHGSLNWLRCDVCDNVYVNPVGAIAYLSFLLGDDPERHKRDNPWLAPLEAGGANQCHCGYRPLRHMIVAPSFVRDVRDPILLEIWRNALEALRQADTWVIVGYSLPPEDVAIRSMLLRAHQRQDVPPPRVVVVQKEDREPERTRYRLLFPEHRYVTGGLAGYRAARG